MIARSARAIPGLRSSHGRSVHRLALSPTCWGVNESPGWGHQLDVDRVLSDASSVGEGAITAGPSGFLPDRSDQAKLVLKRHKLQVVAGQVRAVLHHHEIRGPELAHIDGHASWLSALGADTLVLTAIQDREQRDGRRQGVLSNSQWAHLVNLIGSVEHVTAKHRMRLAVQPRFGSMIEGPEDIERLLVGSEAGVCLDLAHLMLSGADPLEVLELAGSRVRHVHLNDVDAELVAQVREGSIDFATGVEMGLYKPLGEGRAPVARVIEALRSSSYRGWYTLEQETRLFSPDDRPLGRISRSLEYLLPLLS